MDDAERLGLKTENGAEPWLNVLRVEIDCRIKKRHHRQGDERQLPIDPVGDVNHAAKGERALRELRNRHDHARGGVSLKIDRVDQHARTLLIVVGEGQSLRVAKEVAAKVEDDLLLELRIPVVRQDGEEIMHQHDEKAEQQQQNQKLYLLRLEPAEPFVPSWGQRLAAEYVIDDDFQRPWFDQGADRAEEDPQDRQGGKALIRLQVAQDSNDVFHGVGSETASVSRGGLAQIGIRLETDFQGSQCSYWR